MKAWIGAGLLAAGMFVGHNALADEKPVVLVELFTSQGCNSCPPADALLTELTARDDVLPLALHVDYWDYIGWVDKFARPEHTIRQKSYAHQAGSASIFTPQMVVGGTDHVVGNKPMKLADYMDAHEATLADVDVSIDIDGEAISISCSPMADSKLPKDIVVDLVQFDPEQTVEIKHGENAGKTITYSNIVTAWDRVGHWDGTGEFAVDTTAAEGKALALILQEPGPGRVLAAYRLR